MVVIAIGSVPGNLYLLMLLLDGKIGVCQAFIFCVRIGEKERIYDAVQRRYLFKAERDMGAGCKSLSTLRLKSMCLV